MTVSELIEELRKFPSHHVVCVRHPDGERVVDDGFSVVDAITESYIVEVCTGEACEVVIDVTPTY
ncbi:hypothetical protein [Paraburkholderia fungorum]|uniref:hypothetical protein n=1 Tax=Paraburkholderia fungorum TaxID=134537 RepID=UPI001C1EE2C0|nr:hypothetical protein [Paraburkholderia fungorum]MBU7436487.1 hypothetical protein [Paraburkholderia fungorum]